MKLQGVTLAAGMLLCGPEARSQIVTENAGTISPETPLCQSRFEYAWSAHVTEVSAIESFFWAPNDKMDLALSVPVIHRDFESGNGVAGTLAGFGDIALRWKYSIWKDDDVMKSTRFSALAGVELPTGRWHDDEEGVEIPRKLQLGTGSFDFFGGPLFTWIDDRDRFAAELIGRYNLERDDFRLQPSVQAGVAYWYRISPAMIEVAGEKTEIRGVIELTSPTYS